MPKFEEAKRANTKNPTLLTKPGKIQIRVGRLREDGESNSRIGIARSLTLGNTTVEAVLNAIRDALL